MPTTRLYLMRHGQTDWNAKGILQGRSDIALNETGRLQAHSAGQKLAVLAFDAVYSSPLCRAAETAHIVSGLPRRAIQLDERLLEIAFGDNEGKDTHLLGPDFGTFFSAPAQYIPSKGGESLFDLQRRVYSFLPFLLRHHEGKTVLAASHGAAIAGLINTVCGRSIDHFWANELGNCFVAVFEHDGQKWAFEGIIDPLGQGYNSPYSR